MTTISLQADLAPLRQKLEWIASKLQSRDVRERLGDLILNRLVQALDGVGSEKFYEFGAVTTAGTGVLGIRVEAAGILEELTAALRALGFEFHGDAPCGGIV